MRCNCGPESRSAEEQGLIHVLQIELDVCVGLWTTISAYVKFTSGADEWTAVVTGLDGVDIGRRV